MYWTLEQIRSLPHQKLETLMRDFFKAKGYRVQERRLNSKNNINFYLYTADDESSQLPVAVVQCIAASEYQVNLIDVKMFCDAVQAEHAELGILVNSGDYTMNALDAYANNIHLYLMSGAELVNELNALAT